MLARAQKNLGISILELLLALAIIAILLVMAVRYFELTRVAQQINNALHIISNIDTAAESWLQTHDDFTNVTLQSFIDDSLVPANFAQQHANPWNGDIEVNANDKNNLALDLSFSNVPQNICQDLKNNVMQHYPNSTADCDANDPAELVVTFGVLSSRTQ